MRNLLIIGILLISMVSCNKLDKLTQFNLDYSENITIPSSTIVSLPFEIVSPDITTNSESNFESNNTRKDLIEEVILTELKASIISPNSANFSFMKDAYDGIIINPINHHHHYVMKEVNYKS